MKSRFAPRLLLLLALLPLAACDGGGDNEKEEEPIVVAPPTFSIASQTVKFNDGSDGIQFYVTPNEDIILVRVEITNPLNTNVTFNAGSATVVQSQSFPLQDAGFAYFRVSGPWKFQFVGRRASGDQASFNVTTSLSVGA